MKVTFQQEKLATIRPDVIGLTVAHREETDYNFSKEKFLLEIDWDTYSILENNDCLVVYTARTEKGTLVGYITFILQQMLHYKQVIMAYNDSLFLHPTIRKGLTGYKFIKYAVEDIKEYSIGCISFNMKVKYSFSSILERLGFVHVEQVYQMEV